eukprot:5179823-Alexandrium_andersonii.AAC.1
MRTRALGVLANQDHEQRDCLSDARLCRRSAVPTVCVLCSKALRVSAKGQMTRTNICSDANAALRSTKHGPHSRAGTTRRAHIGTHTHAHAHERTCLPHGSVIEA